MWNYYLALGYNYLWIVQKNSIHLNANYDFKNPR